MADPLDVLIGKIETQFAIVHGSALSFAIGNLKRDETGAPQRVAFNETGGTFGKPQERGPNDDDDDADRELYGSIATADVTIEVECWGTTRELARQLMHRVLLATARANVDVAWSGYTKLTEHHLDSGVIFQLRGQAEIQVPADTEHTATVLPVLEFEHHTTAKGVTVDVEYPDP